MERRYRKVDANANPGKRTIGEDRRSEPLAITQLMLPYHLPDAVR